MPDLDGKPFRMLFWWAHVLGMEEACYETPILAANIKSQIQSWHHHQPATHPLRCLCNPHGIRVMES